MVCFFQHNLLQKFRPEKQLLKNLLEPLCSLIQNDTFYRGLVDLELLEKDDDDDDEDDQTYENVGGDASDSSGRPSSEFEGMFKMDAVLNLCGNLYSPPAANDNDLALRIGAVFDKMSSEVPDMVIVVHCDDVEVEDVEIPCHRVILGARCPYFRRALLSGMKEAIEK